MRNVLYKGCTEFSTGYGIFITILSFLQTKRPLKQSGNVPKATSVIYTKRDADDYLDNYEVLYVIKLGSVWNYQNSVDLPIYNTH